MKWNLIYSQESMLPLQKLHTFAFVSTIHCGKYEGFDGPVTIQLEYDWLLYTNGKTHGNPEDVWTFKLEQINKN